MTFHRLKIQLINEIKKVIYSELIPVLAIIENKEFFLENNYEEYLFDFIIETIDDKLIFTCIKEGIIYSSRLQHFKSFFLTFENLSKETKENLVLDLIELNKINIQTKAYHFLSEYAKSLEKISKKYNITSLFKIAEEINNLLNQFDISGISFLVNQCLKIKEICNGRL
jgi:hypothetical protein